MAWFIANGDRVEGPLSDGEVFDQINGGLPRKALLRHESTEEWSTLMSNARFAAAVLGRDDGQRGPPPSTAGGGGFAPPSYNNSNWGAGASPGYPPPPGYPQPYYQPGPPPGYPAPPPPIIINNDNTNTVVVQGGRRGPSFGVRFLYFCLIGWWLGCGWLLIAGLLMASIIGLPIGIVMLAMTPKVFFL